jgi:hypothetical protein
MPDAARKFPKFDFLMCELAAANGALGDPAPALVMSFMKQSGGGFARQDASINKPLAGRSKSVIPIPNVVGQARRKREKLKS